jgi:putative peptidoglycan lipid II flippase
VSSEKRVAATEVAGTKSTVAHRPQGARLSAQRAIGTAALILMGANLSASAFGYVRQLVTGAVFGSQRTTDAWFAASIIPQMFYDLTIGAAVSAALIPTFTEIYEKQGREALARVSGSILALAFIVLAVLTAALVLLADPIMSLILSGSSACTNTAGTADAVRIVRVLLPTLFFLGSSAVLLSTLYAVRRFTVSAFAPGLYHAGIIAGALVLARPFGILALPVGAVAGAAAQASIQVPGILRWVGRPYLRPHLSPEVRKILRLYAPVAAGLVVSIVGQVIDIGFKWKLSCGGVTSMTFATTLTQFPIGIAVAGLSFAILPSISADVAFGRVREFKETLAAGMRVVLFLTVPAAIGCLVLATPIATLLFHHGRFGPQGTADTATALTGYAFQIPFVGIDQLLIFAFYARKNTVTPMFIGIVGVCIYVVSALILLPTAHIFGLALANTLQNSLHAIILFGLLLGAIGMLRNTGLLRGVGKTLVAAALMTVLIWALYVSLGHVLPSGRRLTSAIEVAVPVLAGAVLYLGVAALLRSEELQLLLDTLRRPFARSRSG